VKYAEIHQPGPNYWVPRNKEITIPPGTREKNMNPPENHPISADIWAFLDLWCSGEAREKNKIPNF